MDLRRPDVLTLRVRDLDRSLAFYHHTLRLPVKLRTARRAEVQTETTLLVLLEMEDAQAPTGGPVLGYEVRDLDAAVAFLRELGIDCEPEEPAGGACTGRSRRFRDPDGHAWELVSW